MSFTPRPADPPCPVAGRDVRVCQPKLAGPPRPTTRDLAGRRSPRSGPAAASPKTKPANYSPTGARRSSQLPGSFAENGVGLLRP